MKVQVAVVVMGRWWWWRLISGWEGGDGKDVEGRACDFTPDSRSALQQLRTTKAQSLLRGTSEAAHLQQRKDMKPEFGLLPVPGETKANQPQLRYQTCNRRATGAAF